MGRHKRTLDTVSYFSVGNTRYRTDELTQEQKSAAANQLVMQICRSVYGSNARFFLKKDVPSVKDVFPQKKRG